MMPWFVPVLCAFAMSHPGTLPRERPQSPEVAAIKACSILTKEEVKQHLPWNAAGDSTPVKEEPIHGGHGSNCYYPSVFISVLTQRPMTGTAYYNSWEPISGVGEQAYMRPYRTTSLQLHVRTGTHELRIHTSASEDMEETRRGAIALAKALVTKLP